MQRYQLETRIRSEQILCTNCSNKSIASQCYLSEQNMIYCHKCIKQSNQLLRTIKKSYKQHQQLLLKQIPNLNLNFTKQCLLSLQKFKQSVLIKFQQLRKQIFQCQQTVMDFYLQTKIIYEGYIKKIQNILEKENLFQMCRQSEKINQKLYFQNIRSRYQSTQKLVSNLQSYLKLDLTVILSPLRCPSSSSKIQSLCSVPIHSIIQIQGFIYYGTADGRIIYQCLKQGQDNLIGLQQYQAHHSIIRSLEYDGKGVLYSGSDDFTIKAWDITNSKLSIIAEFGKVQGVKSYHRDIKIFHRGRTMASSRGQFDGFKIRLWKLTNSSYQNIKSLQGHKDYIRAMAINLNQQLITVSDDRTLKVWNPLTCECIRIYCHSRKLICLLTSTQNLLAIIDDDNKLLILQDSTLQLIHGISINKKILCSYSNANNIYVGLTSQVLVFGWDGIRRHTFGIDGFGVVLMVQLGNRLVMCDGKGRIMNINIPNSLLEHH